MRGGQTGRAVRPPPAATPTGDPRRSKRGELGAARMSGRCDPRHDTRSVRRARDAHGQPRLVSARRVVYRAATSRTDARAESTRGCPMSESITGPGRDHLSRRTFLRAAGVTGAAALGPAVLRSRAEAQETPSPV